MPRSGGPGAGLSSVAAVLCICLAATPATALQYGNASRGWAEVISWVPRSILLHGFLSDAEADHVVKLALPSLERSKVVDTKSGNGKLDEVRTSSGTFLSKGVDEVVRGIEDRVALATHLPVENAENLQVLRYELDQEYKAHWDVIETDTNSSLGMQQGQNPRTATLLMYLSDVEEGGETSFPAGKWIEYDRQQHPLGYSECGAKGVSIKPKKGDAILFWSLKLTTNKKDAWSLHAGCPVIRGEKFSATSWIHVKPFAPGSAPQLSQPDFGACQDGHAKCPQWAAAGECARNPVYMRGNARQKGQCRLSCKVCRVCAAGDVLCQRENERPVKQLTATVP